MKVKKITQKQATKIIDKRKPKGLFWLKEGEFYVAIDNSTGDAWTEEFKTKKECFDYLIYRW